MKNIVVSPADKLQILQACDPLHEWTSLSGTRWCIVCEKTINGRRIKIVNDRGRTRLQCPTRGCVGTPSEWVRCGNPLLSDEAWQDWLHVLAEVADSEDGTRPAARTSAAVA